MLPKISIVVHLFNREKMLRETLDSILSQGYPNLELIVVDDASTDNGWEVVESYGSAIHHKIRLTGKRTSPVEALNAGFAKATGEVMTWINTKNKLWDKSLFLVGDTFASLPQVEWLTSYGTTIDDESRPIRVVRLYKHIYDFLIGKWEIIQQESTFWRNSLWERTGSQLDPKYPWSFDAALWTKFFMHAPLFHINTITGAYRETAQAQSVAQRPVLVKNTMVALNDMKKAAPFSMKLLAFIYNMFRMTKPLIRNIPDSVFAKIPILNKFCYPCIEFRANGTAWKPVVIMRNPYRVTH